MQKVICLGAHKTWTTSLTQAMRMLKFKNCPETFWYNSLKIQNEVIKENNYSSIINCIKSGKYDFFEDSPFNMGTIYIDIFKNFPDALYILTLRDPENWVNSFIRWSVIKSTVMSNERLEFAYNARLPLKNHKSKLVAGYIKRNQEIIDFFKLNGGKLLMIDFEKERNPWQKLCEFLGKPEPKTVFPHCNRTK